MGDQVHERVWVDGSILKQVMVRAGLTQNELAELWDCSAGTVCTRMKGKFLMELSDVYGVCRKLGCKPIEIVVDINSLSECHLMNLEINEALELVKDYPLRLEAIKEMLAITTKQVNQAANKNAVIDFNNPLNWINLATTLYSRSHSVFSTSIDQVSKFWMGPSLERYLESQKKKPVVRIFVFSSEESFRDYVRRGILDKHFEAYGETGAVIVTEISAYLRVLKQQHFPNSLVGEFSDFAVLKAKDWKSYELLSLTACPETWPHVTMNSIGFYSSDEEKYHSIINLVDNFRPELVRTFSTRSGQINHILGLPFFLWERGCSRRGQVETIVDDLQLVSHKYPDLRMLDDTTLDELASKVAARVGQKMEERPLNQKEKRENGGSWWPGKGKSEKS